MGSRQGLTHVSRDIVVESVGATSMIQELAKNASAAVSVRAIREFLFIFLSRAGH